MLSKNFYSTNPLGELVMRDKDEQEIYFGTEMKFEESSDWKLITFPESTDQSDKRFIKYLDSVIEKHF